MTATDHLSPVQFYTGHMDPRKLVPTEHTGDNEHWGQGGAGDRYQSTVRRDIEAHGMQTPITVDNARYSKDRTAKPHIMQGHHRHAAAIALGLKDVPVSAAHGVPKGMKDATPISNEEFNAHVNGYRWGDD